jgi:Bacterial Ig domain
VADPAGKRLISRRGVLGAAVALPVASGKAGWPDRGVKPPPDATSAFSPLIGAGGLVTGIVFAKDGTAYCRTDTFGAYRLPAGGSEWTQIVTATSMPSAFVSASGLSSDGVYEISVAPSDSSHVYMIYSGCLFYSTSSGVSWKQSTSFVKIAARAATGIRNSGPHIAVDPVNPLIVIVGAPSTGAFISSDGGATFTIISDLAKDLLSSEALEDLTIVLFDPSSAVIDGNTQGIFVGLRGTGWYRSTNGGSSFGLTSNTPTTMNSASCGPDGYLYSVDASPNISVWNTSTWLTQSTSSISAASVAADPSRAGRVIVGSWDGAISVSVDHGASWSSSSKKVFNGNGVPWIPWILNKAGYMTLGRLAFDPSTPNRLYQSCGTGVMWTMPNNSPDSVIWTDTSSGIEQLVATSLISPPGSGPLTASWDRPFFLLDIPNAYPSRYVPSAGGNTSHKTSDELAQGWDVNYCPVATNVIVGIANSSYPLGNYVERSGYSTDGGNTWRVFSDTSPSSINGATLGGSIAAGGPRNFVWITTGSSPPARVWYTDDAGASWAISAGLPNSDSRGNGWTGNYYFNAKIVCADQVEGGTFYAFNLNGSIYKSTNGGKTWTCVYSGGFRGTGPLSRLQSVPGHSGHLFFTGGQTGGASHPQDVPLYRSTNGGSVWSRVLNVKEVSTLGFGAPYQGGSYPTIYIYGYVRGTHGVWRSTDNCASWQQCCNWAANSMNDVTCLTGDSSAFGWFYVGFAGFGFWKGVCNDAGPWVCLTRPLPGATVSGTGVSLRAKAAVEVACTSVRFEVDGTTIYHPISSGPLAVTWDSTTVANGPHKLAVVSAGNRNTSTFTVPITVSN